MAAGEMRVGVHEASGFKVDEFETLPFPVWMITWMAIVSSRDKLREEARGAQRTYRGGSGDAREGQKIKCSRQHFQRLVRGGTRAREGIRKNRLRVATADDGRRPSDNSSSSTGNAAPAAWITGKNREETPTTEAGKGGPVHGSTFRWCSPSGHAWRRTAPGDTSSPLASFSCGNHRATPE